MNLERVRKVETMKDTCPSSLFFICARIFAFFIASVLLKPEVVLSREIRVSIVTCQEHHMHQEIKESFVQVLKKTFPETSLKITIDDSDEMLRLVREKKIDIFLSNSGFYRTFINGGIKDIATVITNFSPDPNKGEGSVIFVRSDRNDLNHLEDLRNLKVSAKSPNGFAGWPIALREISLKGYDPEKFFKEILFVGWNIEKVFENVLTGQADIGVAQACYLEKFLQNNPALIGKLKVLNSKEDEGFPCKHSSMLYPNWTVGITPSLSTEDARMLAVNLLSEPSGTNGLKWVVATKFDEVDSLLKELKLPPYEYLKEWSLEKIFRDRPFTFIFLFSALFGFAIYSLMANRLIKKRSQQLADAILLQEKYYEENERTKSTLVSMERIKLLKNLSVVVAHEIKNPLNAIRCYAYALKMKHKEGKLSPERLEKALDAMQNKIDYASDVVKKIQSIVKADSKPQPIDLNVEIEKIVKTFILYSSPQVEVIFLKSDVPALIFADPFEISLCLMNLLSNASEAMKNIANAQIQLKIITESHNAVIYIENSGKIISHKELERFTDSVASNKPTGFGVGILLIKEVVFKYHGTINFYPKKLGGLKITITFPLDDNPEYEN